jgi:hypothetical protein
MVMLQAINRSAVAVQGVVDDHAIVAGQPAAVGFAQTHRQAMGRHLAMFQARGLAGRQRAGAGALGDPLLLHLLAGGDGLGHGG